MNIQIKDKLLYNLYYTKFYLRSNVLHKFSYVNTIHIFEIEL